MSRSLWFQPKPWLELFSTHTHINPTAQQNSRPRPSTGDTSDEQALNEQQQPTTNIFSLPPELIHVILSMLEAEQLSILAQVSVQFLPFVYDPRHWRRIALTYWPNEHPSQLEKLLYQYKTWRKLCILRPRLRTQGIYVVRHQYAKTSSRSATEEPEAPVFLVTYHRFLRFYSDGTVVSLTTPDLPHVAVKRVRRTYWPGPGERDKTSPAVGRYNFDEENLQVNLSLPMTHTRFPNMRSGTIFMHLTLTSTRPGACDRLFPISHYAIMDDNGGDLVPYNVDVSKPYRLIPVWGFRHAVYREFPRDDDKDLAQWFEMKKAARSFQRQSRQ